MDNFFENHIVFETNTVITAEEEIEITEEIKKILRAKNPNRVIRRIDDFVVKVLI